MKQGAGRWCPGGRAPGSGAHSPGAHPHLTAPTAPWTLMFRADLPPCFKPLLHITIAANNSGSLWARLVARTDPQVPGPTAPYPSPHSFPPGDSWNSPLLRPVTQASRKPCTIPSHSSPAATAIRQRLPLSRLHCATSWGRFYRPVSTSISLSSSTWENLLAGRKTHSTQKDDQGIPDISLSLPLCPASLGNKPFPMSSGIVKNKRSIHIVLPVLPKAAAHSISLASPRGAADPSMSRLQSEPASYPAASTNSIHPSDLDSRNLKKRHFTIH